MTKLRYLLAIYVYAHRTGNSVPPHIDAEARAALADEPAVPEGREPASVVGEPSDEEIIAFWSHHCAGDGDAGIIRLARWGNPAPQPPAEGEVAELVRWLKENAEDERQFSYGDNSASLMLDRAAELLQRLSPLQPVPVRIADGVYWRWPEFSDCDDTDRVWCWNWAIGTWRLNRINRSIHSHWLPAHALPIPQQQENHQ